MMCLGIYMNQIVYEHCSLYPCIDSIMDITRNIGEQLLDFTKKTTEDVVVHISRTNMASQCSAPRREPRIE